MTVLRTKKRRSYGRELDVEVYGGVKTEMCRGCGQEKEITKLAENCKEFEKRIGRKMEGWWMGLTGRIDEGLLEIIRTIDEEQKNEEREDRQRRDDRQRRRPEIRQEGNRNQIIYLL